MMRVNGKPVESAPVELLELLSKMGFAQETKGIAVAVNGSVVPRSAWGQTRLVDGDDVEIVKIMQGG